MENIRADWQKMSDQMLKFKVHLQLLIMPESKYFFAITFPKINVVVSLLQNKTHADVIPDKHLPK